jgi:hypothetical protein
MERTKRTIETHKGGYMKIRTLIAGAAVVFLCGGTGICLAQGAASPGAPEAAPSPAPASAPASKPKHHAVHHHRRHLAKHHGQKEFTEQELQQMQPQPPSQ